MTRHRYLPLFTLVPILVLTSPHVQAENQTPLARTSQSFYIGNRDEPTPPQLAVFAKSFCVAMRRYGGVGVRTGKAADAFRRFIDPRYLKAHGLAKGDLPIVTIPVAGLRKIEVADDNRTMFATFETDSGTAEAVILRALLHDKCLWITPLAKPNETTGVFKPWILRTELFDK